MKKGEESQKWSATGEETGSQWEETASILLLLPSDPEMELAAHGSKNRAITRLIQEPS